MKSLPFKASPIFIEKGDKATLLLHGFTTSPQDLNGLAKFLANSDLTVYAPLLPGHGTSPEDLNKVTYMDWIKATINAYNELREKEYREVYIIGHSMGGLLALRLGELYGDISGLVVAATPIVIKGFLLKLGPLAKRFVKFIKKKGEINPYAYDVWPINGVAELFKLQNLVKNELKSVISPTLIIQGEKDEIVAIESADIIYENISSKIKRKVIINNAGHRVLQKGEVAKIYQLISDFIFEISKMNT